MDFGSPLIDHRPLKEGSTEKWHVHELRFLLNVGSDF